MFAVYIQCENFPGLIGFGELLLSLWRPVVALVMDEV
jgi:hypothetical protein